MRVKILFFFLLIPFKKTKFLLFRFFFCFFFRLCFFYWRFLCSVFFGFYSFFPITGICRCFFA
ncbi:MAG TPA: hypothetical protein EYO79_03365 [Candidatus Marinimicrobia bacterium]|nr:hypothetical protein [Candidatus Neomarinimicrobiota bacterium]